MKRASEFSEKNGQVLRDLHKAEGKFVCLIHNDAWTNNFMFATSSKGETGSSSKSLEMRAIDFQLCRLARPTLDLAYLVGTSVAPELRRDIEHELLDHYYATLVACLDKLGYQGKSHYPRSEFEGDYQECSLFGYQTSLFHTMVKFEKLKGRQANFIIFSDALDAWRPQTSRRGR